MYKWFHSALYEFDCHAVQQQLLALFGRTLWDMATWMQILLVGHAPVGPSTYNEVSATTVNTVVITYFDCDLVAEHR
jgi:hypothetical protein